MATEVLVSEVVTGTMVIPELWGGENDITTPAPFGVVPSWAMPWFSYCRQEGQAGSPARPPSHPGPVAHPAHGGPSRYEMKVLGYNLMQAMRFAVEEINNDSSLLPDVLLGYEMVDSCYMSNNVQPVLYFLSQDDYFLPIQEDYSHYVPRVVAIIGPDNSESTKTVANFLSLFLLPQVRPWGCRGGLVQRAYHPDQYLQGMPGGAEARSGHPPQPWQAASLLVESSGSGGRQTWCAPCL